MDPATVDARGKPFYWPQRERLRLREFDYATPGAYFLTFGLHGRRMILIRVVGSAVCLTETGKMVLRTPGSRVWESGYWERRVRDAEALAAIRAYIRHNPLTWWLGPKKPRRQRP